MGVTFDKLLGQILLHKHTDGDVTDTTHVLKAGDTMTGGLDFAPVPAGPVKVRDTVSGAGISLQGTENGTRYGKLRIVANSNAWADAQPTAYFQIDTSDKSRNGVFMSGDYADDVQFGRLLFSSNKTQFSDIVYNNAPAPLATTLFEIINSTATKIGLRIRGATSQSANLQEWQNVSSVVQASVDAVGQITMNAFKMATGATNAYVLTSDAAGVGTWQAVGAATQTIDYTSIYMMMGA